MHCFLQSKYSILIALFVTASSVGSALGQSNFLSQNWDAAQRQQYYTTSQGSRMMPYDWFMALEIHDGQASFVEKTLPELGYLPNPTSPANPDGLPVGWVMDTDNSGRNHIGLNCAACHTNQVSFQGSTFQIDGAPTQADMWGMIVGVDKALSETRDDDSKFQRFAKQVLGDEFQSRAAVRSLRTELTEFCDDWNQFTIDSRVAHPWGRARLDAFGMIFNRISAIDLGIPSNNRKPDAPVSYPFLWGTSFEDKVQWNGSAENANDIERLGRNVGEVLGVFGQAEFTVKLRRLVARTSAKRLNQVRLENLLKKLWSPQWPDQLGEIDHEKMLSGKTLFAANCVHCHRIIEHGQQATPVEVVMTPISEVQTDPKMAVNAAVGTVSTGKLRRARFDGNPLGRRVSRGELLQRLVRASILSPFRDVRQGEGLLDSIFDIRNREIRDNVFSPKEVKNFISEMEIEISTEDHAKKLVERFAKKLESYYDDLKEAEKWMKSHDEKSVTTESTGSAPIPSALSYKARPLDGIWATAPYLHNGSVPNLYELVSPRAERSKVFHVGNKELDAKRVGFVTEAGPGTTLLDTSLPGNSNAGHDMYGEFTEEERWQLVEYMKTL